MRITQETQVILPCSEQWRNLDGKIEYDCIHWSEPLRTFLEFSSNDDADRFMGFDFESD